MDNTTWTIDQILGMAPDHLQLKAAESSAVPDKWVDIGANGNCAWGEFSNNQQTPYRVIVALPHFGLYCDCPSRKRPCRHSIALAILLVQQRDLFSTAAIPKWAAKALSRSTQQSDPPSAKAATPAYERALVNYKDHLENIQAGMRELELWLRDMIHQGLASLTQKPNLYWRQMASRLIDAEAYESAKELRQLAALPGSQPDWPEQLLRRIGRLYLLTQGFSRYDSLLPEVQADLRFAAGWFADPQHDWSEAQHDSWLVLGKQHELSGHRNRLRIWLWGISRRRPAQLVLTPGKDDLHVRPLLTGTCFSATLHFFPSAWPVRAHLAGDYDLAAYSGKTSAYSSLALGRRAYGRALSLNPWLRQFPLLLRSIQVETDGQRWSLRDMKGYRVPLPEKFLRGWHLQAVTQSAQAALFGEWDGRVFHPLTIQHNGQWLDLHTVRGVN